MEKIRIRDGKTSDSGGSGMEKIRIRDKHPGSATLPRTTTPNVGSGTRTRWVKVNYQPVIPVKLRSTVVSRSKI